VRLLFDQEVPVPLRLALVGHEVMTARQMGWRQMGWDELHNGALLLAAEETFDAFVTTDQNLRYQQNLSARKLAIVVLSTTSWPKIQSHVARIRETVDALKAGDFIEVRIPDTL